MFPEVKGGDDELVDQLTGCLVGIITAIFTAVVLTFVGMWGGVVEGLGIDRDGWLGILLSWGLALGTLALIGAIISMFL